MNEGISNENKEKLAEEAAEAVMLLEDSISSIIVKYAVAIDKEVDFIRMKRDSRLLTLTIGNLIYNGKIALVKEPVNSVKSDLHAPWIVN